MYLNSKTVDVRLFLWGLFLLQIFLISVFLLFGSLVITDGGSGTDAEHPTAAGSRSSSWFGVRFISNRTQPSEDGHHGRTQGRPGDGENVDRKGTSDGRSSRNRVAEERQQQQRQRQLRRHPKFRPLVLTSVRKPDRQEKYFRSIPYHDGYRERRQLCYIEGTRPEEQPKRAGRRSNHGNNETDLETVAMVDELSDGGDDNSVLAADGRCRCNAQWHGTDCGQPEVLWRAFIASKIPARNQTASPRRIPRNVFYAIRTNFISAEVLEIQIMELQEAVGLFVLCDRVQSPPPEGSESYSIEAHLRESEFLRNIEDRLLLLKDATCSGRNIFRKMQKYVAGGDLKPDDILLYSKADEILSRKAVNYFRWYDGWPQPVRFRLKYNVFGFFWQHPQSTVIGSAACQLSTLQEVYGSDPDRLLAIESPVMLIGDLNHYGGWYCRQCYQPLDVVRFLEYDALTSASGRPRFVPDPKKVTVLNQEYIQQLISNGKDLDGELALRKLNRHEDKYYAPEYVRDNSWRFDNIVINLFARWDDNVADDDYFS